MAFPIFAARNKIIDFWDSYWEVPLNRLKTTQNWSKQPIVVLNPCILPVKTPCKALWIAFVRVKIAGNSPKTEQKQPIIVQILLIFDRNSLYSPCKAPYIALVRTKIAGNRPKTEQKQPIIVQILRIFDRNSLYSPCKAPCI